MFPPAWSDLVVGKWLDLLVSISWFERHFVSLLKEKSSIV